MFIKPPDNTVIMPLSYCVPTASYPAPPSSHLKGDRKYHGENGRSNADAVFIVKGGTYRCSINFWCCHCYPLACSSLLASGEAELNHLLSDSKTHSLRAHSNRVKQWGSPSASNQTLMVVAVHLRDTDITHVEASLVWWSIPNCTRWEGALCVFAVG